MMKLLIVFVIVAAVSASQFNYNHWPEYSEESLEWEDRASGICYEANKVICSQDCKQIFLCVIDESTWSQILIENCTEDTYCNGNNGSCERTLSTCSPTNPPVFQLQCTATGSFPDPYDCTVYHTCSTIGQLSIPTECQAGWSYNALTTDCDHSMEQGVCFPAGPIPPCTTPGQSGPVPENTNIYYVCIQTTNGLAHELFKCAHGGHFSGGQCIAPDETTSASTPTTVTTAAPRGTK